MSGSRLAFELCRATRERTTVAVEWRHEKRRRLFFFRAGELVLVQSNLKSESPERIAERAPNLAAEALRVVVAQVRVTEALGEADGEVAVYPDSAAPAFEPIDIVAVLWAATDRLHPWPPDTFPRAVVTHAPLLARIPAGADVTRYLLELDGNRPVEDVIDFGPAAPDVILRALALAQALGVVEPTLGDPEPAAPPRPSSPSIGRPIPLPAAYGAASPAAPSPAAVPPVASFAPSPTPAPRANVTADIADLIRGALSEEDAADPVTHSAGPPSPESPPSPPRPPAAVTWGRPVRPESTEPVEDTRRPFGGASATVTFGGATNAPPPGTPATPVESHFGPALQRIRGATDHFAVLGTRWEDAPEVHRRAYFTLARRLHPDHFALETPETRDVATELFDRVRSAWEVLGDDDAREAYIAKVIRGEKSEDEKAMERVRAILEAETQFKSGVKELNAGRLSEAHDLFQRATTAMPEELEFAAYAGFTTFRLEHGRNPTAAAAGAARVEAAVRANDKLDNVWVLHGIVQRMGGNEAGARRAFVTALKVRPTNPDASREIKRLEREGASRDASGGSVLSRLFGKK